MALPLNVNAVLRAMTKEPLIRDRSVVKLSVTLGHVRNRRRNSRTAAPVSIDAAQLFGRASRISSCLRLLGPRRKPVSGARYSETSALRDPGTQPRARL